MSTSGTTSFAPDPQRKYYVYAHTKPDGTIFYIGKGMGQRAGSVHGRNKHWKAVVAKYDGFTIHKLADCLLESEAIELEAELIAYFKRFGPMANILDRGDVSPMSAPEVRAAVSKALTGRVVSDATKEKLRARVVSKETRSKISAYAKNRKLSEETRRKIALANTNRVPSEATRAKISAANKGRGAGVPLSDAHRAAVIANHPWRGKKRPEHSALLKSRGVFVGAKNPWYGTGDRQRGALNHMAEKVVGLHWLYGVALWDTMQSAASSIGVSIQAVSQAVKKRQRSKGWRIERVA